MKGLDAVALLNIDWFSMSIFSGWRKEDKGGLHREEEEEEEINKSAAFVFILIFKNNLSLINENTKNVINW